MVSLSSPGTITFTARTGEPAGEQSTHRISRPSAPSCRDSQSSRARLCPRSWAASGSDENGTSVRRRNTVSTRRRRSSASSCATQSAMVSSARGSSSRASATAICRANEAGGSRPRSSSIGPCVAALREREPTNSSSALRKDRMRFGWAASPQAVTWIGRVAWPLSSPTTYRLAMPNPVSASLTVTSMPAPRRIRHSASQSGSSGASNVTTAPWSKAR